MKIIVPALLLACAAAQAGEYQHVDAARSQIRFTSKQMGVPVDGVFRSFDASLAFDPQAPAAASGQLRIALASIDTGNQEANEEVAGAQWFDTRRYPMAQFELRRVLPLGAGRFQVSGMLNLKGVSRPLTVDATLKTGGANQAAMDGAFVLKRLDFGVGGGVWGDVGVVANEVTLRFHLVLEP